MGAFSVSFVSIFCSGLAVFVAVFVKGISQWGKNNASPVLSVPAKVISKRINVTGEHSHTRYYITFEVESGDRLELQTEGEDYGVIVEGDFGKLTFQGTRFKRFERQE